MNTSILISETQLLDLFFRFMSAGMLSAYFFSFFVGTRDQDKYARAALVLCLIGYILLTAPIDNVHYGWLRPPLLLLTDCTAYALFCVYWHRMYSKSCFHFCATWLKYLVVFWFLWLGYFFFIERGIGNFHSIHHGIGLLIIVSILVHALIGYDDDLVENRRHTRKLTIVLTCSYMTFLTLVEIFLQPIKDHWLFSLTNAALMLTFTTVFLWRAQGKVEPSKKADETVEVDTLSAEQKHLSPNITKLTGIMEAGFYTQNGLTISMLAKEVNIPQHQLMQLINKELGFENFSHFLNSYRIPAVSKRLKNSDDENIPILTMALEVGFNSIAPFNRAFKSIEGVTPSEYRRRYLAITG